MPWAQSLPAVGQIAVQWPGPRPVPGLVCGRLGLFKLKRKEKGKEGDQEKGSFIKGCLKAGFPSKPE